MHFVCFSLIHITGAGGTYGTNKVRNDSRHRMNPPHPIPVPYKLPALLCGNKSVKLNIIL